MEKIISVVIPALNEEKRISRALDSLKNQDYPREKFELIVVDNGSTDRTVQIAQKEGAKVVYAHDLKGVGAARQAGFEAAECEIIASMDADSSASVNWLSTIEKLFQNPRLVAVSGVALPLESNLYLNSIFSLYHGFLLFNQLIGKVLPWGFNFAVRRDAFTQVGGFNTSLQTSEDWDLSLRLQKRFGRSSVIYSSRLKVYTSTRKQRDPRILLRYLVDGTANYLNVAIRGRAKSKEMMKVR